jgi:hypothetical protein
LQAVLTTDLSTTTTGATIDRLRRHLPEGALVVPALPDQRKFCLPTSPLLVTRVDPR